MKDIVFHDCGKDDGEIIVSVGPDVLPSGSERAKLIGALNDLKLKMQDDGKIVQSQDSTSS